LSSDRENTWGEGFIGKYLEKYLELEHTFLDCLLVDWIASHYNGHQANHVEGQEVAPDVE
jgi:hypothetical protein